MTAHTRSHLAGQYVLVAKVNQVKGHMLPPRTIIRGVLGEEGVDASGVRKYRDIFESENECHICAGRIRVS